MGHTIKVIRQPPRFDGDHDRFYLMARDVYSTAILKLNNEDYKVTNTYLDETTGKQYIAASAVNKATPTSWWCKYCYVDALVEIHPYKNDEYLGEKGCKLITL